MRTSLPTRHRLIVYVAACFLALHLCAGGVSAQSEINIFFNPKSREDAALTAAIEWVKHGKQADAAKFLDVLKSDRYNDVRRRRAALIFLRLFIQEGTTSVQNLGAALSITQHLTREEIKVVPGLAGNIPINMGPGTVFRLRLNLPKSDTSAIYMRVEGRISESDFINMLLDNNSKHLPETRILEMGFSLSDNTEYGLVAPKDANDHLDDE